MSKQHAAKFLDVVSNDASLLKKLIGGPADFGAWISAAKGAGYEFGEEDLRFVTEQIIGKPVAASETIGALRGVFEGDLSDEALDAVSGGTGGATAVPPQTKLKIQTVDRSLNAPSGDANMCQITERTIKNG